MARLKDLYNKELAPKLKEELGLANVMEVPRITKITLNMGVGEADQDWWSESGCHGSAQVNCGLQNS
jgi:ribosomal protein L5